MRRVIWAAIVMLGCALPSLTVSAEPRLPKPHHGKASIMARWSTGGRGFSPTSYGSATRPASNKRETLLRAIGTYGLSRGWAIEYDLRGGVLSRSHHHVTRSTAGLEDQLIGIERALHQQPNFADAIAFNVLIPGSRTGGLSAGVMALQPGYEAEIRGSGRGAPYASMNVAARLYSGGYGGQWHIFTEVGAHVTRRLSIAGLLTYYRSMNAFARGPAGYDELRAGIELRERLWRNVRPFLRFEQDLAGRNIHDLSRISLGIEVRH